MRDPSIHIRKSDLIKILKEVVPPLEDTLLEGIIKKAKHYSCANRAIVVTNGRIEKKVNKIQNVSKEHADIFAKYLLQVRRSLRHKGVLLISPGHKDWPIIRTLTERAIEFCDEFNLKRREGFLLYLNLGISRMAKFALPKLVGMHESIFAIYQATLELRTDPTPQTTEKIYNYYRSKIAQKTSIVASYKDNPEKYLFFFKVNQACKKYGVDYHTYIDAQFAMMEFRGMVPDPYQLVGDKAAERLNKYIYKVNSGQYGGSGDYSK